MKYKNKFVKLRKYAYFDWIYFTSISEKCTKDEIIY